MQAAQEQFKQGRDAFKANDFQRALTLFRKSQELYPATGTLLNLAVCEARLGQLASALRHLNEVIPQLGSGDQRLSLAKKELAELEPRVPRLRIQLAPDAPPDTTVTLDGAAVELGGSTLTDPGQHAVEVSAPGHAQRRYDVSLAEGTSASLNVEPGVVIAPVAKAPPPDRTPERGAGGKRIAGFVIGGVGVAGLGVGAVTGILALGKKSEVEGECPIADQCTPAGVELAASGKTLSIVSTVAFGVGVAGVGAGLYLVLTSGDDAPASAASGAPRPITAVGAVALPGGGGLTVRGTF